MTPFVIIYDKYGSPIAGSGYLGGSIPQVPIGVLAATQGHKINKVTWEPAKKVRIASVSVEADNYYVLGGRSLSVVESNISSFSRWLVGVWVATMVAVFAVYSLFNKKPKVRSKPATNNQKTVSNT
jgi:hypothetical protein